MAYTARKLITKAYYLSQIVSRNLQTVSGGQLSDGLDLLNALLDVKGSDVRLIPYFTKYEFETEINEEKYFIENLVSIETLTFNLESVRFATNKEKRRDYFGSPRVNNISTLPFNWHAERVLDGMDIYFYPLPYAELTVTLTGKFALTNVTADTDLSMIYDSYYIEYLRYALAEYLCADYGIDFSMQAAKKFGEIRKKLMDISPPDLSIKKSSTLQYPGGAYNWGDVNLGKGWRPPSSA